MISQYNFEVLKERLRGFTDGVLTSVKDNTTEHDPFVSSDPMAPKIEWAVGKMAEVRPREGNLGHSHSVDNDELDQELLDLERELELAHTELSLMSNQVA